MLSVMHTTYTTHWSDQKSVAIAAPFLPPFMTFAYRVKCIGFTLLIVLKDQHLCPPVTRAACLTADGKIQHLSVQRSSATSIAIKLSHSKHWFSRNKGELIASRYINLCGLGEQMIHHVVLPDGSCIPRLGHRTERRLLGRWY